AACCPNRENGDVPGCCDKNVWCRCDTSRQHRHRGWGSPYQSLSLHELAYYLFGIAMLTVYGIVQPAHVIIGNSAREFIESRADFRMLKQRSFANDGHRFIWREVVEDVLQYKKREKVDDGRSVLVRSQ